MNMLYKGVGYLRNMYNQLNPATLTGAIDIVVVEQEDGTYLSSPFHVRFGKLGVLRAKEKLVKIIVNEERIPNLHMKLGDQGEAFFVEEINEEESGVPSRLICSPLPSRPSTPTEKTIEKNSTENSHSLATEFVDMEYGKRRRKKKRKRRDYVPSNTSFEGSSESSETDDEGSSHPGGQDMGENKKVCSEERKASSTSVRSYSEGHQSQASVRGFLSDSELPLLESAAERKIAPYSDSEATEDREQQQQASMMWGWGQLPHGNENGQDTSSDDSNGPAGENEDNSGAVFSECHFKAISTTGGTVEVIDETRIVLKNVTKDNSSGATRTSTTTDKKRSGNDGLYLDDVLSLEPSEADLYLKTSAKATSRQPSLHNELVERTISPGLSDIDSGTDSQTQEDHGETADNSGCQMSVSISFCGFLSGTNDVDPKSFEEKSVSFETFLRNPVSVLNDPNLVFRVGDRFMNWQTAAPSIVSLIVFKQPLSQECMEGLIQTYQQPQQSNRLMGWFGWRKQKPLQVDPINPTVAGASSCPPSPSQMDKNSQERIKHKPLTKAHSALPGHVMTETERIRRTTDGSISDDKEIVEFLEPELKRSHSAQDISPTASSSINGDALPSTSFLSVSGGKLMRKTTRLNSQQLASLSLKPGANKIVFSVTTQYQGTTRCQAAIYLWKWSDKIVVSDIDGTITKSDVFGQILPVMGKDWTQNGVAQLYQNIGRNGYKFIYLSARAIGQASMTKDYLNWINQQGVSLPPGPLLLSPTSLMIAFRREVIEKKPEKFKIECLKDIKALFPSNPFSAGFGNKTSDVIAYTAVGVPNNRLFTINHRGELKHEEQELQTYTTSYTGLGEMTDNFFPPMDQEFVRAHDFSDFTYWRDNIMDLSEQFDVFYP